MQAASCMRDPLLEQAEGNLRLALASAKSVYPVLGLAAIRRKVGS